MSAIIIHGHFYQPPRENPWTGALDPEESARPYHDWNERIHAECYRANAWARILDNRGYIERIVNNYCNISFNFGPTLLTWLEQHYPETYSRIIEADRQSSIAHDGHGNAIAQGYNHAILPLCNPRDRKTQILWGIADFEHRFGRTPEALWLPETACNHVTLDALIDARMKFAILSPFQAEAVRELGESQWTSVAGGGIDPRTPYAYFHSDGSGRSLAIFFYDGAVSRAIAFEGALASSQILVDRLVMALGTGGAMTNVATDGESYGHHSHFGDRCLAYALEVIARARGLTVTNYGAFLKDHSPRQEVQIKAGPNGEGTAWSCAHGVGRWYRDCGCGAGGAENWNQAWRGPLRAAFDLLRDEAAGCFEEVGGSLLRDPWAARDDYVEVMLHPERDREGFFERHASRKLGEADRIRVLTLLEMQRGTMLMYTSCGWFFADISGIEAVQVIKYAGRVMDFMEALDLAPPTSRFLEILAEARSNIAAMGTGADIYRRFVEPCRVMPRRLAAHLSLSSLAGYGGAQGRIGDYLFRRDEYRKEQRGRLTMATSRLQIIERMTGRRYDYAVGALHLGGLDLYGVSGRFPGAYRFRRSAEKLWAQFPSVSLPSILRLIQSEFGPNEYQLDDVLPDGRRAICEMVFGDLLRNFSSRFFDLYRENRRLVDMLEEAGFELPQELRVLSEFALSRTFEDALEKYARDRDAESYRQALEIADEAARRGFKLIRWMPGLNFGDIVDRAVRQAVLQPNPEALEAATRLAALVRRVDSESALERAQEVVHGKALERSEWPELFAGLAEALALVPNSLRHPDQSESPDQPHSAAGGAAQPKTPPPSRS